VGQKPGDESICEGVDFGSAAVLAPEPAKDRPWSRCVDMDVLHRGEEERELTVALGLPPP
jgi:hypothetical protein